MKNSDEWIRQDSINKACDQLVTDLGCHYSEVRPYRVAKAMNCEPNGSLYEKVRNWRLRQEAENPEPEIEVPAAIEAELRGLFDRISDDGIACFKRAVRRIGGDLDRAAALRTADAERRLCRAEEEVADLLALCQNVEGQMAQAQDQIARLESDLALSQASEQRLLGRLEQREIDERGEIDITRTGPTAGEHRAANPVVKDMVAALARAARQGGADIGEAPLVSQSPDEQSSGS